MLIVCCDGPAGLPEAARGDLARLHGPHLRGPPDPRHPCGSSPTGTARGSPPPCARACTAPDERGWLLLRQSLHDPVLPLNIESDVDGGVGRIEQRVMMLIAGFKDLKR